MTTNTPKAVSAINTNGPHTDTNGADLHTTGVDSKAIATQVAHLAIAGHAVHPLADGGYLVCKYGYTYEARDFEALQVFARKLGVNQ
jgi:hypothetical protein